MQRLLNTARARSLGKDILGAAKKNQAFLPTSVFLATSGSINYDEESRELFFDSDPNRGVCPLDVVDGQHRIEGLKEAASSNKDLLDFPIAAVIATNMSEAEKMLQFMTVNTKQQPLDKGVAQHIIARFTKMIGIEELPYLPSWIEKQAEKGDDEKALIIATDFNTNEESPWLGRIQFANESKNERHTVKQASFVASVKRTLLARNHPLDHFPMDKQLQIMRNYWKAVQDIFITPSDTSDDAGMRTTVFKYTGLEFFHSISGPVINVLAKNRCYTVEAMKQCLHSTESHLGPDAASVMSSEFWETGRGAGELNASGRAKLTAAFSSALSKANSDDIQM